MTDFGSFEQIRPETPYAGIDRRVLTTSKATVQEYRFEPGASFPIHHHAQEQITVVIDGEVSFSADGESRELAAGEWSVIPGDVPHGVTAGPAGARFIAILVPPRKEPLK
ncbi:MAG TPA: cupin domain-containing protein [Thermoleophilaceae bacterium]